MINSSFHMNSANDARAILNNVGHGFKVIGCNFTSNFANIGGNIHNQNWGRNLLISQL